MAKTLTRILHSVIEKYSQYKPTDDLDISEEFIIDKINDIRSTLIRDEYTTGKIDEKYYQRSCCWDIECYKQGCTIAGEWIPAGTVIYGVELPALITDVDWNDILFLGSSDWQKFHRKTLEAWMSNENNPWTGNMPIYTVIGNMAYIKNKDVIGTGMKKVCGVFLLANPVESCDYNKDETIYPVPSEFKLELLVLKDILSTGYKGDILSDAQESTIDPRDVKESQQNLKQQE